MSIFNKIINREIPANIVYENKYVIAFKDINPLAPVHILVVPKKEITEIFLAIKELAKELNIAENGYRVINNCNKYGGQEVFHLHFHLLGGEPIGPMRAI